MSESELTQPPSTGTRSATTPTTTTTSPEHRVADPADHPYEQTIYPDPTTYLPQAYNLLLSIPDPESYYDTYHHPLFPFVLPQIHSYPDLETSPLAFPYPIGPMSANRYNVLGATLHDFSYVNRHAEKRFTKYMLWYLEVNDHLLRLICPSDLNDMPCEWDELQGGCRMLRLCEMKHKFPHPHLGPLPLCLPFLQHNCKFIHDVEPSCRSLAKQLVLPPETRFRTYQRCNFIAEGEICCWGHDLESSRVESVYAYWGHREGARRCGARGVVKWDVGGRGVAWRPICPVDLRRGERLDGSERRE